MGSCVTVCQWIAWVALVDTTLQYYSTSRPLRRLRVVSDVGGRGCRAKSARDVPLALDTTRYCSLSRRSCAQHHCFYQASGRDELSRTVHLFFFRPESVDVVWCGAVWSDSIFAGIGRWRR